MAELPAAASRNLRQAYSPEVVHSLDHHTHLIPMQTLLYGTRRINNASYPAEGTKLAEQTCEC